MIPLSPLAALAALLCFFETSTHAFAPARAFSSSQHFTRAFSPQLSSATSDEEQTTYPALSTEEVEQFLSRIPVYAVTDASSGGVVLMSERSTDGNEDSKGIGYLFITREAATATMKQLKGSSPGSNWDVTALSLGAIWFELLGGESQVQAQSIESGETLETSTESVEYRLVPSYRDLDGARSLLSQTPEAKVALEKSGKFAGAYGDVPIYMDLQIRMEEQQDDGSTVEKFPMYLALDDMVTTCQQFIDVQGGETGTYEAAINVAELKDLLAQMQAPSTVDFRKAVLIPPTPLPDKPEKSSFIKGIDDVEDTGYSPTMNDNWAD